MLKNKKLTYVSLFSSAGVGCYGFKQQDFHCVASNELLKERIAIQKVNAICSEPTGFVCGDITKDEIKKKIHNEIDRWKKSGNDRVDVVVATPPCQGISVINHKKNIGDINRNSLVVESVEIVNKVRPRFFIFENVMAFEKTLCITNENIPMPIGDHIRESLGQHYIISGKVLNLMNYGSKSSRTRSLVIGVDKKFRNLITPYDLFPDYQKENTLREAIFHFPHLEWGAICKDDFYHAFRKYNASMRPWISGLKEGESAFDNIEPSKRPHKLINGHIVENTKKTRDKYKRQKWDRFVQCIHTRNDQLAAQNTVHPVEDRVYSIRELMEMMTIPANFQWVDQPLDMLNQLSLEQKRKLYKTNELNIRRCIGEAVPTEVFRQIACKIQTWVTNESLSPSKLNDVIFENSLLEEDTLLSFVEQNTQGLSTPTLMRIAELCNAKREENAAFYTNKFLVNEIMNYLPNFNKEEIRILEPSCGVGNFLPFLFKKYEKIKHVSLDIVDVDAISLKILQILLSKMEIPDNFSLNIIHGDFLKRDINKRYDLAVGNPPFSKIKNNRPLLNEYLKDNVNKQTSNVSAMFLEKCIRQSDCVSLVLNKNILSSPEFRATRNLIQNMEINSIIDFGRNGFTGVSIETINLTIFPKKRPKTTTVYNLKYNKKFTQLQSYMTDKRFPYFIIYRDENFDYVADKLNFGMFDVFRDRQITKSNSFKEPANNRFRVIKAKNVDDEGLTCSDIPGYDMYIPIPIAEKLASYQFVNRADVYLTPNMTYNPRVMRNIPNTIPDGSIAVLIPKYSFELSVQQMKYFSTEEFRRFYKIARNLSTQSINVDNTSVFFYGILKDEY